MPSIVTGGCRCRKVRYECAAAPVAVTLCYCRDCQSWSGGALGQYVIMPSLATTIVGDVRGYDLQAESTRTIRREYCNECGSPLFATTPHLLAITVASFDDPAPYVPTMAIWVDSAQPWAMIPDAIPRFDRNPPLSSGDS
ncbi:MAG: hypothetical protein ACI9BW_003130 [Gammaproteobacteria bacterium]|jgi:hypothetical protein